MTRQLKIVALSGVFLLSSLTMVNSVRAQDAPPDQPIPTGDQMTNIPYFTLRDGMSSMLTLNNNMTMETKVVVMVFNAKGRDLTLPAMTLQPSSITDFDLADLLKDTGDEFDSGNIEVAYQGRSMGVTAQVGVYSLEKRVSFESREQDMMDFMSSNLNGIVSLPGDAKGFLALTNVAEVTVNIQLTIGLRKKAVILAPREMQLLKLSEELGEHPASTALIQLQHNGKPGDVITTGFVLDLKNGYSSAFIMSDPSTAQSSTLAGAGLRSGQPDPGEGFPEGTEFRSPLLLANVGAKPVTAHVSVDYTIRENFGMTHWDAQKDSEESSDKHSSIVKVRDLTIAPGEVQRIELSDAIHTASPVEEAGVDIACDGAPGSVIGQLTSVDQSGDYAFEVPIKDPSGADHAISSSYPWTLEGTANTTLHLKNTTGQSVWAGVQYRFPGGGIYQPDRIQLQPYQTLAIDIQKLKDSKKLDVLKRMFPGDATHGQVEWAEGTPYSMIGRAEQVQSDRGIARSFSCPTCGCKTYVQNAWMNPASYDAEIGWTGTPFAPEYHVSYCNGPPYTYYAQASSVLWSSSAPAVADISGADGQITTHAGGTSTITATFDEYDSYTVNSTGQCKSYGVQLKPNAPLNVNLPDHVHVVSDNQFKLQCPPGATPVQVRQIYLQMVDVHDGIVQTNYSVNEVLTNQSPNTCGNGDAQGTMCILSGPTFCNGCTGGQFSDTMAISTGANRNYCPTTINAALLANNCGHSLTSTWSLCTVPLANRVLGYNAVVGSNSITVNNTLQYAPGTILH